MDRLVYFEAFYDVRDAIARAKEIKKWRREKKNDLVRKLNPKWEDLGKSYSSIVGEVPRSARDDTRSWSIRSFTAQFRDRLAIIFCVKDEGTGDEDIGAILDR